MPEHKLPKMSPVTQEVFKLFISEPSKKYIATIDIRDAKKSDDVTVCHLADSLRRRFDEEFIWGKGIPATLKDVLVQAALRQVEYDALAAWLLEFYQEEN